MLPTSLLSSLPSVSGLYIPLLVKGYYFSFCTPLFNCPITY